MTGATSPPEQDFERLLREAAEGASSEAGRRFVVLCGRALGERSTWRERRAVRAAEALLAGRRDPDEPNGASFDAFGFGGYADSGLDAAEHMLDFARPPLPPKRPPPCCANRFAELTKHPFGARPTRRAYEPRAGDRHAGAPPPARPRP